MQLNTESFDQDLIIVVASQRIDAVQAIDFKEKFRNCVAGSEGRVILDLTEVTFIDSSGLGALVASMKTLGATRKLELCGLQTNVEKVFRLTRLDSVFKVHSTANTARTSLGIDDPKSLAGQVGLTMLERKVTANTYSIRFPATFADVTRVLEQIKSEPPLCELSDERFRDLELVLAESLNNVSEHAYAGVQSGDIALSISHRFGVVRVEITDSGKPVPISLTAGKDPVEPTAEGGRGWWLIRTLCKSVNYQRSRGTNRLTLEFISSD